MFVKFENHDNNNEIYSPLIINTDMINSISVAVKYNQEIKKFVQDGWIIAMNKEYLSYHITDEEYNQLCEILTRRV